MSQGNRMAEIEYFYSAHSAFAYLGSARFMEISRAANPEGEVSRSMIRGEP